jgi:hypothetical protein
MSRNASFVRKITYIAAIALLLLPLAALSQPAAVGPGKQGGSPGGKLSQLREDYGLAQARLGEIDPASETMKLASLGLRGVAANVLWLYANHYKKVEDWDKLELTVQQIIRLQPNFLEVWDFQAHNLSYNVSVEFDDYRMRYEWVKKGIRFLIEGTHYNRQEPGLLNQVGWYVGQKVGRSDEQKQFRRMFKTDEDFHKTFEENGVNVDQEEALGPDVKPDNWLVARLWFNRAVDAVTGLNKPIRGKSPLLFYSGAPMSQINGAAAMQKDGYFFQRAQIAWQKASDEWRAFGDRELPATEGFNFRMNEMEERRARVKELQAEVDKLVPGIRPIVFREVAEKISKDLAAALDKPAEERTADEKRMVLDAAQMIEVPEMEIVNRAPRESRPRLRALAEQIENDRFVAGVINRNRHIVNFDYWRTRVETEKTDLAQSARKNVFDADKLYAAGEKFADARKKYEAAWDAWAQIFKDNQVLMDNAEAQELIESIGHYRDLLNQLDEKFPADFPLNDLLDRHHDGQQLREQVRLIQEASGDSTKPESKEPENKGPENKSSEQPQRDLPEAQPQRDLPEAQPPDANATPKPDAAKSDDKPAGEKPDDEKK